MEQPIGKTPSLVDAAAIDPAHVPGLVTPAAGTAPKAPEEPEPSEPESSETEPSEPEEPAAETDAPEPEADSEPESDAEPESEDDTDEGPAFSVSDRRGSITVDGAGVRFELDDQTAEWRWEEIGAVEYDTPRFGKRLTVVVHTPDRRWYPNEVEAPARSDLKEWTARLDEALDAWFEDE
ncbi:hypothetical protein ACIQNU_12380 [Streptomyces sp. NPDC091292]|uniref:hypothetical protein n=1 Tax=Streptomyces sp. NPDC091292 TaxID=3365991 RepID=UPI0038167CEE